MQLIINRHNDVKKIRMHKTPCQLSGHSGGKAERKELLSEVVRQEMEALQKQKEIQKTISNPSTTKETVRERRPQNLVNKGQGSDPSTHA